MSNFFEDILKANTNDLMQFSKEFISGYYENVFTNGDYYVYGKGSSRILIVAHADTVRKHNNLNLVIRNGKLINLNGILGADDRAGVYLIFKLVEQCVLRGISIPSVLITNYEEYGMIGCRKFINNGHAKNLHKKTDFVIGLDREGYLEYVTYNMDIPNHFHKYLQSHGFNENYSNNGSDIKVLMNNCNVPCVNISIGYYNRHSPIEYLNVSEYCDTFRRIYSILKY